MWTSIEYALDHSVACPLRQMQIGLKKTRRVWQKRLTISIGVRGRKTHRKSEPRAHEPFELSVECNCRSAIGILAAQIRVDVDKTSNEIVLWTTTFAPFAAVCFAKLSFPGPVAKLR